VSACGTSKRSIETKKEEENRFYCKRIGSIAREPVARASIPSTGTKKKKNRLYSKR